MLNEMTFVTTFECDSVTELETDTNKYMTTQIKF